MRKRTGYLVKRGKIYYAVWTLGGKKFMKTTAKANRREAEVELHRIMEPFVAGDEVASLQNIQARIEGRKAELVRFEDEKNPPLRLDRAWDAYEMAQNRPDSGELTLGDYRRHWATFVKWMSENHPEVLAVRDVTEEIAAEYAAHLVKRGLSANRFNKIVGFLKLFFRVVRVPARLASNPWEHIQRKTGVSQGRREMTVDELRTVIGSATGELRLLFGVGIYTGLRLKDAATLQWGEVDLQRGVIRRIPSKTARRKPQPVLIPIHPVLGDMLAETPTKSRKGDVLPETAAMYRTQREALSRKIQNHFQACEIDTFEPGTGQGTGKRAVVRVSFHSLRHSFVSLCREANAPLSVVEAIVGHSNPAMTRHYSHVGEETARASVLALPAVIGEVSETRTAAKEPTRLIDVAKVHALAKALDEKNLKKIRTDLLKL